MDDDKKCFPIGLEQDVAGGDFIKVRFYNTEATDGATVRIVGFQIHVSR